MRVNTIKGSSRDKLWRRDAYTLLPR